MTSVTGYGAARLARLFWEQKAGGSNPPTPIFYRSVSALRLLSGALMRKITFRINLTVFSFFVLASVCLADTAYKWTDNQGRIFFGTKPPKSAGEVSIIKARTYSRYKPSPSLAKLTNSGRARLGRVKEVDLPLPPKHSPTKDTFEIKTETPTNQTQVELSVDTPIIKVGAQDEIESCSVTVKNKTSLDVEGVQISFEFADGTLVPAVGPSRLNIGQAALYSVDPAQMPIKLQAGSENKPKVIVNTDGETNLTN